MGIDNKRAKITVIVRRVLIICPLTITKSFACLVPPTIQYQQPSQLIARNKHIVLAKVKTSHPIDNYKISYHFQTLDRLKGKSKKDFHLMGITDRSTNTHSFNNHTDNNFWQQTGGRLYTSSDCQIYPSFTIGSTYLLFLDKPYHIKGFEKIEYNKGKNRDKWLSYVKNKILDE